MASYSLLASYQTVQVLSPAFINDVVYCTIRTSGHGVIASIPIQADVFNQGGGAPELTAFANNIETLFGRAPVIGAQGSQTLDVNGLLEDQIAFVVEYVPPGSSNTSITAEALVPAGMLTSDDNQINQVLLAKAEAIIDGVYAALKASAGG